MVVYHSTDELEANVKNPVRIETFGEFLDFALKNDISLVYSTAERYIDVRRFNIWIKSVDKFVPDYADDYGNIYYKKDENGQAIPTDGCWLQLFFIVATPAKLVFFTSAGLNTAGITKWTVTGAVRPTFIQESVPSKVHASERYQQKIKQLANRRKPNGQFLRIAIALASSDSESFLDVDKAFRTVYGSSIKAEDREKVLSSPGFREAFMSVIKTLFPTLAPAIRKEHSPEKLAALLTTMWQIAEGSKDIDKMLKVFTKIQEVGYEEPSTVNGTPLLPVPSNGQLTDGKPTAREIEFPDPVKLSQNEATDSGDTDVEEEEIETLKEDLDYPDSYIIPEGEEEK